MGGLVVLAVGAYFLLRKKGTASSSYAVGNPTYVTQPGRDGRQAVSPLLQAANDGHQCLAWLDPCCDLQMQATPPQSLWPHPRAPPRLASSWRRWVCVSWVASGTAVHNLP